MPLVKPAPLPPHTVVGGYRIIRQLAAGGFAMVYLARDAVGRYVAIKEYLPATAVTREAGELAPKVRGDKQSLYRMGLRSFFEEGRVLAQISHPSVVSALDFFAANDTVYLVMNYLEGATLQDFIRTARENNKRNVFQEPTLWSLLEELLQGLAVLHQHSMLHLDIQPANVFMTDDDRAVLIDLGAAGEIGRKHRSFVRATHTQGFAAPEMYQPRTPLGPWTDIYALGACLYACMLGSAPCDARQRANEDGVEKALAHLRGQYSDKLLDLVAWCMAQDPLLRPQSVAAVCDALGGESTHRNTRSALVEKIRRPRRSFFPALLPTLATTKLWRPPA
jgi:serine/threonine protein kinase